MMITYTQPVPETTELFGPDIDLNPWIAFHGTSGGLMGDIERFGLDSNRVILSKSQISDVVAIFDEIKWYGIHGGGFSVLKNFSLNHDRSISEKPPIYLAESSHRAGLYATADFAGGECARALRHAFHDLHEFVDGATGEGSETDRRKVAQKLTELTEIEALANSFSEKHEHGVIYAVQFCADDLPHLKLAGGMGIKSFRTIGTDRFIAKLIVPVDWQHRHQHDRRRTQRVMEDGLIRALRINH